MSAASTSDGRLTETRPSYALPLTADTRRVSWGAVLAGIVVSLAVHVLLAMLGTGIGFGMIDTTAAGETPGPMAMGMSSAVWWAVSGIIAAFAGGWVAARLAGVPNTQVGVLHGLAAWAATTLLVLYFITTTVGAIVGGAFNVVGQTVSSVGSAASSTIASLTEGMANPLDRMEEEIFGAAGVDDPEAARNQLMSAMRRMLTGDADAAAEARQTAIEVLQQQGVSQQEAEQQIQRWQQQYQEMTEAAATQAREAADTAASAMATASLYAFIALLLGAIAGAIGGRVGTPPRLLREV